MSQSQNERNLFKLCKKGDLNKIKQLVEKEDAALNIRDIWDSTPLYYACLCGHLDLVEYLLANGARCDMNTFDGERCQYGALTDQIRNVLRNFKVVTSKLDEYELFLERLYELGYHSDIMFEINGRLFKAHKCILAARSCYFKNKFEDKWKNRTYIIGTHEELVPEAFDSMLKYLYTGRFSTFKTHFHSCVRLAKLFKLEKLLNQLETKFSFLLEPLPPDSSPSKSPTPTRVISDKDKQQLTIKDTDTFLIGKFGAESKLSNTITIEPEAANTTTLTSTTVNELGLSFRKLLEPSRLETSQEKSDFEKIVMQTADLCFHLENQYKFYVHQAFVVERCEYFKTFLHDPFNEIESDSTKITPQKSQHNLSHLSIKNVSLDVFIQILYFIYTNNFSSEKLEENLVYDVLQTADLYLLPGLKRKCANELAANHLNKETLFDFLKLSRLYDLKKLEFACIHFLAQNILEFESSDELRLFILEDASSLKMRQETDTIDIIDDLRYAINEESQILMQAQISIERLMLREKKLYFIDNLLNELNLEC